MNNTKKIIALFLAALCLFSLFSVSTSAAGNSFFSTEKNPNPEIDEIVSYGVHYDTDSFSGVKLVYKPNPDIELVVPSKVQVSGDFPLAIDHKCIAWKDTEGNLYYPGEYILVEGKVNLYAVWIPKEDNDPRAVRAIKTGFEAFIKMLKNILGFFEVINHFEYETTAPTEAPTETTLIHKTTAAN